MDRLRGRRAGVCDGVCVCVCVRDRDCDSSNWVAFKADPSVSVFGQLQFPSSSSKSAFDMDLFRSRSIENNEEDELKGDMEGVVLEIEVEASRVAAVNEDVWGGKV